MPGKLKQQVCFALYSASRAVTGYYRPLLEPLGLTYPQYLVMLVLWDRREREERAPASPAVANERRVGEISVKDLGTELMLDSGTLSPLLKRLDAAGLVTRRRDPADERSVLIALTRSGDELRRAAADVPINVAAASGLAPRELAELRDTLTTLTQAMLTPHEE